MEIHQLVHTLSYGDAISGEVIALQRFFQGRGIASEIYAIHVHPFYKGKARSYEEFPDGFQGKVLLHYSLGSPLNALYRRLTKADRTLIYHNLTPAHWFEGVNPRIVADINRGLEELPVLCKESTSLIADSHYNAEELRQAGFKARVLSLPLDIEKWNIPTNEGIANVVHSEPGIHVLHVGRLAPNKCIEDIIKIFYFLNRYGETKSRLWLVGIDIDTELYSFALKRIIHELDLQDYVTFTGSLADSEVKALYESASVYLCMSEHEGFCLPVVEAMHFGLPVISCDGTALGDTVGKGGIVVREKRHPEIAELILKVARDMEFRKRIVSAGHERVKELSLEKFHQGAENLLLS